MATEADVSEPISATQRVGEIIYLASGQPDKTIHETSPGELKKLQETHNLPCETAECSAEAENTQEADNVGAETINTVIKGNVETPKGERFLESPSVAVVDTDETCLISKHCQADEESFQKDKEMSENKKQMQNNTTNEIAQETGSGENKVVEELEEKAENNDRSHDIVHLTGTSLQAANIEESNLGNRGEGSLEDESYVDQHVDVIEDQQDSDEDKSTNKETRDMQKNEKAGDASLESNKQVLNTTEVALDQNKEISIHIPDPGVISLNKDIETAAEPCNKAESIKDKFTGEELGKTSSEVDDTEKSTNLVGEEESPEATRLSEREENEEDESSVHEELGKTSSEVDDAEKSTNLVGEEESPEATGLSEREENEEDESSVHEAGPETGEKFKEVSSISCEEKNNNKIEPSERMDQTSPVEDEMNHKNNIDTCFAVQTEETCLQKVDNPELLKVVPRSWSDDIIKESPKEVKEKIEMIEKTAEGDSTSNEKGKDYENPEQKEESSFMKHEGTTGIIEVLAATDIPSGENRDEGGSTVVVAEDSTDDKKLTDDLEHNQSGKSNSAESSDNVQQNEPEMEKLDESLSTVAQDFSIAASNKYLETITCDKKEAPIKSNEESFVERMIDASQQSQSGMASHEERPEQLQQNEPEKEKLDGSSNLVNVDFGTTASTECAETISCAQEEAPIKSREESFAEKMEEDVQTHSQPTIETGIPKDKNVPVIEMNEKIDDLEVRVLNKDGNDLQVTYPSIEVAVQGKDLDQISNFEPEGQTHEAYKTSTEQKHIEDTPEVCQSSNSTISDHTSTETEMVTSEPIPTTSETDMTKLQEACRLDSEENSMIEDSSKNKEDQEMKTNEEAYPTVTHEILAKGDYAGKDMIDAEALVEVNRATFLTYEMVEQKFHIESSLPAVPTMSSEDETYKPEDNAKTKLEEALPVISDDTEIFSSSDDKIPCLMEEEAPPDLEETALKEEKVNETEENNETKDNKIAKEEDIKLVAETSEASTESIVLEPKTERDKMEVEDDTQKGESEELYKDSKTDGEGEDTEKQNTIEECVAPSILPEPVGENSIKSIQEDQKEEDGPKIEVYAEPELASACEDAGRQLMEENTVDQCKDLEVKKTVQSSEEDDTTAKMSKQYTDTYISVESIELETVENSQGNKYKEENSEAENRREQIIEEGLIPESIEQDPTQDLNDEIQKTGKSTGEMLENSETAKAVKSIAHETSETTEIPKEILDTSPVKHEENFLSEGKMTEASLEEKKEEDISPVIVAEEKSNGNELVDAKEDTAKKPLKNEADLDHILQKNESGEKLEQSLSVSIGIEIFSSNADESPCSLVERASENLEETAQTEENNEAKHDKIAIEEDLKVVSKASDASKSIESIVLEPNSELDNIVVKDDTRKGESEEVHVEPETTSIGEDAEKHIMTEESTVEQCRVTSEEDDKIANISKQGAESIEQETVESPQCNTNNAEESEAVNNTEYIIEDSNIRGLISESVEQDPPKNLNDETMKAEKSSGEIFENSKTAEGVESSAHETLDVIDTSLEKQRDNLQSEGDNPTPTDTSPEEKRTEDKSLLMVAQENSSVNELLDAKDNIEKNPSISEEDLEHISQKNETGEKLDQSLSKMVDETESFSSNADKIPRLMEEGAPQNEEAARNEEETERNNETRDNKIAVEEDLEVVAEISNASKSEENIAMEPKSEMDKIVDGDDTKNGDSEELSEDSKDTGKGEDTEKQNIAEADQTTSILPEPIGEKALQSFAEEEKEEETPKIEIFENSETARAAESIAHETSETIESSKELLDTSPVKHEENLESEGKTTETSLEEKNEDISPVMLADKNSNANELVNAKDEKKSSKSEDDLVHILQKNESEEKLEQSLPTMPDEIEILSSNADKTPCLMVEGASQNLEETAQIEDKTEVNDEAKHNKIVMEEDLKEVVKMSDASKSIESTVLEQESELDKMVIEDDTTKLYEDSKNVSEDESNEEHNMKEECATTYILPEPLGVNIHQSVKDEKEEETPEIKVHVEPDTTSIGEDAEKQIRMDENTVEQCRVLEAENIEQNPEEDDKIVKLSKQENVTYIPVESVEQETVESSQGSTNNAENSEAENNKEYTIEDGNIRGLIPESDEQDPVKNLNYEKMKAEKSSGEIFDNSKTAEAAESIAHETSETLDIIDTSLEKKRDNLQSEGDNLTPIEASPEEKDEDRSPVMAAQDNSSVSELLDAKDNIEKNPSKTEEDLEHILHKDEPGEKLDQSLSKTVDETEAFSANADKISRLMEEGASQNEDAARNEEETEKNNETKDNKIAVEEDLKVVAEISDASKSEENIALEPKSEMDEIVDGDDIKNRDSDELSKDSKDTGEGEDTEKQNIAEACHATSILPEPTGEKALRSFAEEEKEEETPKIEGGEITQTINESEDTGKQNIEEGRVADTNIEVVIQETDEEGSLKNENKGKEHEEEVDDSNPAVIEKIESTSSAKETVSETLKDRAESNVASHHLDVTEASEEETHPREIKEDLVEKSVLLSAAFYEDSKEEIAEKEETKFNYSDSVSVTEVKEEADLQEAEAEDRNRVESFGPVSEEKGTAETETREITLESGDMKVKPEDTSNVSEMMDKDIPLVADEDRIDRDLKNEVPRAGSEDQEEVTTNTMPLKVEDELIEYSTMASEEHKLKSSEARETVDETPETIQAPDENEGTPFVAKEIDEILMQKHDKATNPLIVSESMSIDSEKETANEVQKHKVDGLYVHPELENEKDLRRSEDVEILKREETKELTEQSDICTSKTSQDVESSDLGLKMEETKDEKPFDEALKCSESTGTCTEIEKAIIEQEISEGNLHGGIEVEKAAIEQREEAYSQRHEDTSTKDDGTLTEENSKSVDPDQKFKCASESVAEDPSKAILPESDKSKIEEKDNNKKQQDEKEIEEKEEPTSDAKENKEQDANEITSDAKENKEQDANEITKVVIFTEKELGGVEQLDDIEDMKEPVIEKEQGRDELHALSTVGETTNQVKDSTLVCCSNAKVAESKEKTDTENSEVEKDSTMKREASFARQSEEQKLQDESIETPAEELEEKKKEKILEESEDCRSKNDNATMPIMTAEKSSEQVDKLLKASNIDPEPCPETSETENSHQSKEIDIMKLEETSSDLTSNLPTVQDSHAEKDSITVENTETSACEETKIASEAFYDTKDQGTEETDIGTTVEKKDQVPSYDHDHAEKENATLENSDEDEVEETKIVSAADQGAEGTFKIGKSPTVEGMDQVRSSNSEHAEKESRAVENPKPYEVNESEVSSDAIYMSKDHSTEESDGKTSNVEIPDQVPVTNSEHAKNESVTEENPDTDDADETKMASNAVFKSEEKATKDIDEIRKSPTAEKQDAYKIEEASKVASDYRTHGGESLREDEITTDQTLSTEQMEEPLSSLTSATTTTVEKIEEEEKTTKVDMLEDEGQEDSSVAKLTEDICLQKEVSRELDVSTLGLKINKDIQDGPTEVHEEECQNSDAALQLEPQEDNNNKIEYEDSSSESKNTTDLTGQTEPVCDLKFETREKPLESEIAMHYHGLTESEDTEIKEKHLVAVITEMGDEEKQLKQTSEANEITQNEASHGEITEEKEAAKTNHPVSLCEETTTVSLQEDELKADECVEGENASKNIEEQVATEDRSVQDPEQVSVVNEIIKENFPNEFEVKDTEDAAIKLGPINQGEETNFGSGKTETTTPRDEVDDSNPAVIEKIESTSSAKETVSETLKDRAESNVASHHLDVTGASEEETHPGEIKEDLVEKSVLLSEAFYEDSKEEIAEKEETKFNYSDSVSVTEVKEEADLQEAEAEDRNRVESFGPVSEEKGIAETETREITLESGDMKVQPEDTSNVSEMMDKDIPVVADEDRIDKDLKNEVPRAGSEDQEEVTTNTMPLKVEDELIEYSTMASEEHKLKSSEARETVDETPETIQAPDENEGTPFVAQEIDEILMQKHDKATNPLIVSESRSIDSEKETANEVQKHKVDGLYVHPELENEKDLRRSEDVEILKREETKELTDQSDICTSKTLQDVESSDLGLKMEETKDEKPFDEALKCSESTGTCTEIEKAIIEQEISEGNLHGGIEVEKAAIEQKEEAYSQRHEDTSTKDDGTLTEENSKSEEQVATGDRSVQDPEQVSVVNEIIKESFPNEFEAKDTKDVAIKLAPINQGEETNFGSGKTETTTPRDDELGIETSQKESIKGSVNGSNLIEDIQELENNSCATTEKQIPTEADLIGTPKTIVSTGKEGAPSVLQEGITEVGDFEPGHASGTHLEAKGIKHEEGKTTGDSEEETIEETAKIDTAKNSLSALLQTSKKETPQVAEHVTKERELTASPEELQTEEAENIQIREAKTGEEKDEEEEGEEHKKTDLTSDALVVVDVPRDMDVKVAHKKSHGILSNVGSKVKHSISKVKKAITGKSSHHPKPVSPK
ncbi:hypothetical protein QYF36_027038 [Acer negundo]|nr:hypothetical protein QYF36_027038 [Acer negundo]